MCAGARAAARKPSPRARARADGCMGARRGGGDGPGIAIFAIASAATFASLQGVQRGAAAPRPGPRPAPLRGASRAAVALFARSRGPAERVLTRGQTRPMPATAPRRLRPVGGRVRAWRWGGARGASPEDEAGAFIPGGPSPGSPWPARAPLGPGRHFRGVPAGPSDLPPIPVPYQ